VHQAVQKKFRNRPSSASASPRIRCRSSLLYREACGAETRSAPSHEDTEFDIGGAAARRIGAWSLQNRGIGNGRARSPSAPQSTENQWLNQQPIPIFALDISIIPQFHNLVGERQPPPRRTSARRGRYGQRSALMISKSRGSIPARKRMSVPLVPHERRVTV